MKNNSETYFKIIFKQIQTSLYLLLSDYIELKYDEANELAEFDEIKQIKNFIFKSVDEIKDITSSDSKDEFISNLANLKNQICDYYITLELYLYNIENFYNSLKKSDDEKLSFHTFINENNYDELKKVLVKKYFFGIKDNINQIDFKNDTEENIFEKIELVTLEIDLLKDIINIFLEMLNYISIIVNFAAKIEDLFEENILYKDIFYSVVGKNVDLDYYAGELIEKITIIAEANIDEIKKLKSDLNINSKSDTESKIEDVSKIIDDLFFENIENLVIKKI